MRSIIEKTGLQGLLTRQMTFLGCILNIVILSQWDRISKISVLSDNWGMLAGTGNGYRSGFGLTSWLVTPIVKNMLLRLAHWTVPTGEKYTSGLCRLGSRYLFQFYRSSSADGADMARRYMDSCWAAP